MKLEDQVCSLELARKLKMLGVKQESLLWWHRDGGLRVSASGGYKMFQIPENTEIGADECYSAFTVAELGEMLPHGALGAYLDCHKGKYDWTVGYGLEKNLYGPSEADARAKMLIYLLENSLITIMTHKNTTTKPELTQKVGWLERFRAGCNSQNISDPPTDTEWIEDFIASVEQEARRDGAIRGLNCARALLAEANVDTALQSH